MVFLINIIAAIILFIIPIRTYRDKDNIAASHPFDNDIQISVNYELWFLVYSIVTAMIFLGPLSLVKYVYWILFLLFLLTTRQIKTKNDIIVKSYFLFVIWAIISTLLFSTVQYQALMLLIKYILPILYLWLGYSAINDEDDLIYFMKIVAIGMAIYALFIGGFPDKFLFPIYSFLVFKTGGLFTSYASLADYYSSLIVIPIGLYLVTSKKKWLYLTLWVILSTLLDTVRTGLGGIFLASSLFIFTIYKIKSIPWILGLCLIAIITVFTVPSLREKMFTNESVSMSTFSVSDANFNNIQSNAREWIWDMNLNRFYEPHQITGSGLGESVEWMKNRPGLKLIHNDYVQILCDLGNIGIILLSLFYIVTFISIISTTWHNNCPYVLKVVGGMALGSCAGTFFSMSFDNVITYAQQSFVMPFVFIGIYLKIKDLITSNSWASNSNFIS